MAWERPELVVLLELFPLKLGLVEIEIVDEPAESPRPSSDELWAPVRVITYEPNGWVRDVLQQDLRLVAHPNLLADRERVRQCVDAHAELLAELLARPGDQGPRFPAELLYVDQLLALRKANSREDFVAALRAHKRLGKWLNR